MIRGIKARHLRGGLGGGVLIRGTIWTRRFGGGLVLIRGYRDRSPNVSGVDWGHM